MKRRKGKSGVVNKYSTQKTACSQTHLDGQRVKKKLQERVHRDRTGIVMQRDLFSAFLGLFVNQEGNLSMEEARNSYPRLEPVLNAAWTEFHNVQVQRQMPFPRSS